MKPNFANQSINNDRLDPHASFAHAVVEACERCPNLNLAPTGRLLIVSGGMPGAAELREAAPHLSRRDFIRVWGLVR